MNIQSFQRPAASSMLLANPVVAVLRADHAREYAPVIEALVEGGVRSIELTLSTNGVFDHLGELIGQFEHAAEIGLGTITSLDEAEQALDLGAAFLVTPTTQLDVIAAAVGRGIPVFPGGLTPTELASGWQAGATAVKLFPASVVGSDYIAALRGPFPDIQVVPSGGIDIAAAPKWIAAGALAVSLGGPLIKDAFKGGDLVALTERALHVSELVAEALAAKGRS
ncbi:2-dehydro-3-deoxyphosphogluconate aldolase [Arthrobacter psychrolactophilus]|uniref:2-dehydro-3-deoxyphosphogluconate aldolase n=1 Tax=Arthrobacter psychrolactophilus TaxID=92442 RepID=A0A2V5IRH1_9MICC|nr:bifunctional 4-hydroxy-2-oxoglutarate aldolase/2-dehydro-3-deoxy-phosphogluconate aldolase [Arthrobacter psychrolactophilus]PYI39129.1 2-dehydro-3-deoxyphosphogluconate aldolase [Arthrobacter psychrolactophilus]